MTVLDVNNVPWYPGVIALLRSPMTSALPVNEPHREMTGASSANADFRSGKSTPLC